MFPRWILLSARKLYPAPSKNIVSRASDLAGASRVWHAPSVSTCEWKNKSFREERDVRLSEGYYRPGAHVRRRINDIDIHVAVTSRAAPLSPQKFLRESDLSEREKKRKERRKKCFNRKKERKIQLEIIRKDVDVKFKQSNNYSILI